MHPKSFVSNFWGAVQKSSLLLFVQIIISYFCWHAARDTSPSDVPNHYHGLL